MIFLGLDPHNLDQLKAGWKAYQAYLESVRDKFPPGALAFATAPWHYDMNDHRCPHDGWVESLTIIEPAVGEHASTRHVDINLRLLGAYHDGSLELRYANVHSYSLTWPGKPPKSAGKGHGDWLLDEVRLSEAGAALHEIQFESGRWHIKCADLVASWHPYTTSPP